MITFYFSHYILIRDQVEEANPFADPEERHMLHLHPFQGGVRREMAVWVR